MIQATCHIEKASVSKGLCANCYARKWRGEHPEQVKLNNARSLIRRTEWMKNKPEGYRRNVWLKSKYGITAEQYAELLEKQHGACAICRRTPGKKPLNVDHDHITGRVRGLLCLSCNQALGKFGDNEEGLMRVISYLKAFSQEI